MLPGRRTLVCGVGPLLYAVAAAIVKAGGEVAAVVDAASELEWASRLPRLGSRPDLLARGASRTWALRRAGVRIVHRADGWTPSLLAGELKGAFASSFTPPERSEDYFNWDPI